MRSLRVAVAVIVLVMGWSLVVGAQERTSDEVSRISSELSKEIYSPYCPGKTLAMCPSGQALEARMEIQDMAREGMPKEEIKAAVLDQFGAEFELVAPPARDNWTLFGGLIGGLAAAVFAVGFLARRRSAEEEKQDRARADADDDDPDEDKDLYLDELRAEVRE